MHGRAVYLLASDSASGLRCRFSAAAVLTVDSGHTFTSLFEVFCTTAEEGGGRHGDSLGHRRNSERKLPLGNEVDCLWE